MIDHVTIFEMGPRDGLQNEDAQIATADKIALVDALSRSGLSKIEVTSFVSSKWVPQMADARDVLAGISRNPHVTYTALTPNMQGFHTAVKAGVDEVAIFASASEGFSQNNINCSIAESLDRFAPLLVAAKQADVPVRGYVSCVVDCPYDGPTSSQSVADVTAALIQMGCYQVSLGDTLGHGTPDAVGTMLDVVLAGSDTEKLAGHFHDTKGYALDNIGVCLSRGLRVFDSSIAGLGGCPYAPGAKGNVATEAVVDMLHKLGFETGIDQAKLAPIVAFAKSLRTHS